MEKEKNMFGDNPKLSFFLGLFVGIAVISTIAAVVLVVTMMDGNGFDFVKSDKADTIAADDADDPTAQPTQEAVNVPEVNSEDNVKGKDNAKVTLISYSDFECPYCAKFRDTMDELLDEYGNDVRLVFRHFPLSFHANARSAAMAAECAGEQDMFWEMYQEIFDANELGTMSVDAWKQAAEDLGLDTDQFDECLDSEKYANKINEQMQAGVEAGVRGTPATFINGMMVSGALPYDTIKQVIESELQ